MSSSPERSRDWSLRNFQGWFLGQVIEPCQTEPAAATNELVARASSRSVGEVVLPSDSLSADERIAIYSNMYLLRIQEALAMDYPAVRAVLGEEAFGELTRDYLTHFPSRSFSLDHTGYDVPRYLAQTRRFERAAPLADVARLERAVNLAFHAEPSDVLSPAVIGQIPVEQWPELRFRFAESVHVLSFDHPANAIVSAVSNDEELPALEPERSWVVVWRKDYTVWRQALSEPMHAVLSTLYEGGTVAEAVEAAEGAWEGEPAALEERLFAWFADWLQEGLLSAVVLPPDGGSA